MKAILYRITLLEPTLVTALEGDPNEGVAFDYLPGSVLRGAVVARYLRSNNLSQRDAADPTVRRLFFDGTTRYLNGYPLDRLGKRTLPTPLSWQCEKGNEREIFDFAVEAPDDDEKQWHGVSKPFCSIGEQDEGKQEVRLVQPERHIAVHTARTRRFGRAMPANVIDPSKGDTPGAVYRYNALAAGQSFEAVVLCENDADADTIRALLDGEATLGGSRSAGYGRVRFQDVREVENWREVAEPLISDVDGKLIVTLLSDALLRDENGQFSADPRIITNVLSKYLGVSLTLRKAFLRDTVVGGFNRKWGLPLPQSLAVAMGSVFVYDAPRCDPDKLLALEQQGIGERRAEGFGRLAINWHREAELKVDLTAASKTTSPVVIPPGSESERLLKQMAACMLRQRLDERLIAEVHETDISNPPSNAQLYRLRNIIHDELMKPEPNPQRVLDFLKDVEVRNTTRKQFQRARIRTRTLLEWIEEILKANDGQWNSLFGWQPSDMPQVGGVKAELTHTLRTEYTLRFIDAVLARAAKKGRREGG
jgi:CRISPR-associated protein Csx10